MPFPTETSLQFMRNGSELVATEFEQLYAQIGGWLGKEHASTGAHKAITATSIAFPSDGTALSVYAEGEWTPAVLFGGASTGVTYQVQVGRYTRIGRLVIATAAIVLTSKGSSTGNATLGGLPFTVGPDTNGSASVFVGYFASFSAGTTSVTGYAAGAGTAVTLSANGAGGTNALTDAEFTNTSGFQLTAIYFA